MSFSEAQKLWGCNEKLAQQNYKRFQENLRILSGFYGVLKPMDGVTPYRLEMQAKTEIDGVKGLYHY